MTEEYDKLVRDRIPERIEANGETPVTRVAAGEEYRDRLAAKLVEEATEFREDRDPEELADVLEVVHAARAALGLAPADLERLRREKAAERGGFEDGVVLERVE